MFKQVTIVGVGLIGGSLGLEIKKKRLAKKVIGFGRTRKNLVVAKKRKIIDQIAKDLPSAVRGSDFVILCTPIKTIEKQMAVVAKNARPGTLVMDVGSTKSSLVSLASRLFPKTVHFVGAHPLAGTEKGGAAAALTGLFRNKNCLVTPTGGTSKKALIKVKKFWSALGSNVSFYTPNRHDSILALTSHLPHVAAFSLINLIGSFLSVKEIKKLSGGGLLDTTRVAASPHEMWRDICLANSSELGRKVEKYSQHVKNISKWIEKKDKRNLTRYFAKAAELRKKLS